MVVEILAQGIHGLSIAGSQPSLFEVRSYFMHRTLCSLMAQGELETRIEPSPPDRDMRCRNIHDSVNLVMLVRSLV